MKRKTKELTKEEMKIDPKVECLKELLLLDSSKMFIYLRTYLREYYEDEITIEKNDNYMFVKGTMPVCLVAHVDTVFQENLLKYIMTKRKE